MLEVLYVRVTGGERCEYRSLECVLRKLDSYFLKLVHSFELFLKLKVRIGLFNKDRCVQIWFKYVVFVV